MSEANASHSWQDLLHCLAWINGVDAGKCFLTANNRFEMEMNVSLPSQGWLLIGRMAMEALRSERGRSGIDRPGVARLDSLTERVSSLWLGENP